MKRYVLPQTCQVSRFLVSLTISRPILRAGNWFLTLPQKSLTIKNCDKTFLKIILRLKKIAKKRRRFDVSWTSLSSQNKLVISKVRLQKNFGVVGLVSYYDINIDSQLDPKKTLIGRVWLHFFFAYRDLPLPPIVQTYGFSFSRWPPTKLESKNW